MTKSELISTLKKIEQKGSVYGLSAVTALAAALDNPEADLKIIHIAGTNGKGSILSFISSVLTAAGYKTGAYSSPAVMNFYDKIKIDGSQISEEDYLMEVESVLAAAERGGISPTLFELETVLALKYFKKSGCDFALLETGLGGELDATNFIQKPVLTIIASIGKDHTALLGDTIDRIAAAKAGIIKQNIPIITAETGCALKVIGAKAEEKHAPLITSAPSDLIPVSSNLDGQTFALKDGKTVKISLLGSFQQKNAALALTAINTLKNLGVNISDESIAKGMLSAKNPARMEIISQDPLFICDGCHNPQGAAALKKSINQLFKDKKLILITGILKDKDYKGILKELLPLAKLLIAVTPNSPRALNAEIIEEIAKKANVPAITASLAAAPAIAKKTAAKDDVILACGSLSYMGEIIKLWKE